MFHDDLFPDFPCAGELVVIEAVSTEATRKLRCSSCGTEFTIAPDGNWVKVVYVGMKSPVPE